MEAVSPHPLPLGGGGGGGGSGGCQPPPPPLGWRGGGGREWRLSAPTPSPSPFPPNIGTCVPPPMCRGAPLTHPVRPCPCGARAEATPEDGGTSTPLAPALHRRRSRLEYYTPRCCSHPQKNANRPPQPLRGPDGPAAACRCRRPLPDHRGGGGGRPLGSGRQLPPQLTVGQRPLGGGGGAWEGGFKEGRLGGGFRRGLGGAPGGSVGGGAGVVGVLGPAESPPPPRVPNQEVEHYSTSTRITASQLAMESWRQARGGGGWGGGGLRPLCSDWQGWCWGPEGLLKVQGASPGWRGFSVALAYWNGPPAGLCLNSGGGGGESVEQCNHLVLISFRLNQSCRWNLN